MTDEEKHRKFDVIIGNPPYQEDTNGAGRQAKPLYNLFVEQAKLLDPQDLSLIIPSRWFAGGMGLNKFRDDMMNDTHIKQLVDYTNAKDCFPNTSIGGGVCYFVRDSSYDGECDFINIRNGKSHEMKRKLNEFPVLVRYNEAIDIIRKVLAKHEKMLSTIISSLMPFGLNTSYRGRDHKSDKDNLRLYASSNSVTYINKDEITKGFEYIDKYKVMISKTSAEHAGEPKKDGTFRVIPSSLRVLKPNEVCTHSYFLIGCFDQIDDAEKIYKYLQTKLIRFLILMSLSGIGLSKLVFNFVPYPDMTQVWTDDALYQKYDLNNDEIDFVESMIADF